MKTEEIFRKFRGFLYSIIATLIIALLVRVYSDYGSREYIILSIFGVVVFFLLTVFSWWYGHIHVKQRYLPQIISNERSTGVLINHFFVPLLLYLSLVVFLYFDHDPIIRVLMIFIAFFIFGFLFNGISTFYEKRLLMISFFDSAKLFIFFLLSGSLILLGKEFELGYLLISLFIFILAFILHFLMFVRTLHPKHIEYGYMLGGAILITIVYLTISTLFSYLLVGFFLFLVYYFSVATITHKIERTLTFKLVGEYLLVLLVALVLLLNIS